MSYQEILFTARSNFDKDVLIGRNRLIELAKNIDGKTPYDIQLEASKTLFLTPFQIHKEMELLEIYQEKISNNKKIEAILEKLKKE